MLRAHRRFGKNLVCPSCAKRGYAPGQYEEHQCEECLEKKSSLSFDKYMLLAVKRKEKSRLVCQDCQTKLRCGKCNTAYALKYWSQSERHNHSTSQRTKLICKACRAQGFHPRDLKTYACQTCAREFGASKFNQNQLHHFKYHQRKKLRCLQCDAAAEERVRQLREQLRKSKRTCTRYCRKHQEGNCSMHHPKCPLTPVIFGERRWPGSDGAISADDRKFLDELNPPPAWWSKAWGR